MARIKAGTPEMSLSNYKISSEQDLRMLGNMFVVSRALHVIAEQKIADLFEGNQAKSVEELVKQQPMSATALRKILRVLCPFGIFKENADGTFSIEEIGQTLKSNHSSSMRDLLFCEDCRWNSFGQMSQTLQTGEAGFSKLYKQEYFDYISKHSNLQARFDDHMKAVSAKEDLIIAKYLPLENRDKIIDVGAGKGGLIRAMLEKHPEIVGGIFDLKDVVEQESKALSKKYGKRLEVFSGSFFDPLPFKSDGLILKRVLHDWDDASCIQILSRCREALSDSSAKIYVIESLVKGEEDPALFRIFDLLLLTVFGGVERSAEVYESLFSQAGLKTQKLISTNSEMSILVASK
ncbi:MAG: Multifunctional cyclase-dehydratase-3-O-methyl transferase TcmN [Chlamydiae bacterium]|nr:Multifunctional cyclase-dehydratase-3-O-methyl transferase TcmN [Chlamydiota bacterium]